MSLRKTEQFQQLGGLTLFVSTVAAFHVSSFDYKELANKCQKGSIFSFMTYHRWAIISGNLSQINPIWYDWAMRKRTYVIWLYRYDLRIYDGSRGTKETLVRGNGFPRNLWHCTFHLRLYHFRAAIAISSTIAIAVVICGLSERFLLTGVSFLLSFLQIEVMELRVIVLVRHC